MQINRKAQALVFTVSAGLGGAAAAALAIHVVVGVVLRLMQFPVLGIVEFIQFVYMPTVAVGAAAAAQRGYQHITVDLLARSLKGRSLVISRTLVLAVLLALSVALTYAAFTGAAFSAGTGEAGQISGIPIWPGKALLGVSMSLLAAMAILQLADSRTYDPLSEPDRAAPVESEENPEGRTA